MSKNQELSENTIRRSYRAAYLAFDRAWGRIQAIREQLPSDACSKSPVLNDLYLVCDKAIIYMMNRNRKLWPRN